MATIESQPPQLLVSLKDFVAPIKQDRGSVRLVTDTRELGISREDVVLAYERITNTFVEDATETIEGTFLGALMGSRVFEFQVPGGDTLKGSVDDAVEEERLAGFDEQYINKRVRGVFQIVTVKRLSGAERKTYTLLDVQRV